MKVTPAIQKELKAIREEIKQIREILDDRLSEEDRAALVAYEQEKAAGALVTHEQMKRELGWK